MELNKSAKKSNSKIIINPENSIVLQRNPDIQLYLECSNLKIKADSFYTTADEKLNSVIEKANSATPKFILNLAQYLADSGIKLSPVILTSILSFRGYSFKTSADKVKHIYNTPQRIAEAFALENNKYGKLNNSFKKHILKPALEEMKDYTLKKNKLSNRKIKLKDLIKILRPKPQTDYMGLLYKSIIEDTRLSKLSVKDSLIAVKSDKDSTITDKKAFITKNIKTIPINQLIRNLKFIEENFEFKELENLKSIIYERFNGFTNYRIFNVFDLITASLYTKEFQKLIFDTIKRYINNLTSKSTIDFDKAAVLFDVSGSMGNDGIELGFKYLVLFSALFESIDTYLFSDELYDDYKSIGKELCKGNISKAKELLNDGYSEHSSGTALIDSLNELLKLNPARNIIVISDEVSWKEGSDLIPLIKKLNLDLSSKRVVLINPAVYEGSVFNNNIVGISSLTPNIIGDVLLALDTQKFINFINNY